MLIRIVICILAFLGVIHVWHWVTPDERGRLWSEATKLRQFDFRTNLHNLLAPRGKVVCLINGLIDIINRVWVKLPGFGFCVLALVVVLITYKLITKQRIVW